MAWPGLAEVARDQGSDAAWPARANLDEQAILPPNGRCWERGSILPQKTSLPSCYTGVLRPTALAAAGEDVQQPQAGCRVFTANGEPDVLLVTQDGLGVAQIDRHFYILHGSV